MCINKFFGLKDPLYSAALRLGLDLEAMDIGKIVLNLHSFLISLLLFLFLFFVDSFFLCSLLDVILSFNWKKF